MTAKPPKSLVNINGQKLSTKNFPRRLCYFSEYKILTKLFKLNSKYVIHKFQALGCKVIGIRNLVFAANIQFLWNFAIFLFSGILKYRAQAPKPFRKYKKCCRSISRYQAIRVLRTHILLSTFNCFSIYQYFLFVKPVIKYFSDVQFRFRGF